MDNILPSDPYMLLSMVNMKLRDEFDSLRELCASMDTDITRLSDSLKAIGYEYDPATNQFKAS